ncbi:alcohol dehydrogenase catalytic domain-containing protein [Neobacillus sp. PS2-9]|uniref:alcohol dehydrogenase catalytic domain-containing protein n=1 Tax=Neobacillus sp. PS2-9 TaxID=3070676 RepID=UPI0027DEB163|nr:alcohol dehydrogenase catalytic domain-containing protein [Neobacillus sp. PS2-9]WML55927.1 alcohol dehydrogenase catalytic domain-containing protein [Neobacillus sp. PS2-9]
MIAVVFNPEKVMPEIQEVPIPVIGDHEVLIKVKAAALNHRDLHITNSKNKRSFIYGSDGAGEIIDVGKQVTQWSIGNEVVINSQISCLQCEYCLKGEHSFCESGSVLGGAVWGGTFAEYVKVPAANLERKPNHLTFAEAAALPLAFGTAWRALFSKAKLQAGESILIEGIGGGVALYSLQLALSVGAKVFVTSSSDEKLEKAVKLGATAGFNYRDGGINPLSLVPTGFDVIVSSNSRTLTSSIHYAKKGGRLVQFSFIGENLPLFDIDTVMGKQLQIFGSAMHSYTEFKNAFRFVEESKLMPVVSNILPLESFEEGFSEMKQGNQFGKIVFTL